MKSNIDLSELAVDRGSDTERKAVPGSRRRIVIRYVLPAALAASFLGLVGWAARESLLPAKAVTVVPVIMSRAEVQQAGTPLFQAAGWVEPSPTPVLVSAQAAGVIDELLVVEGQAVNKNEPIAKLIDTDARLALEKAETDVQLRQADLDVARAAVVEAKTKLAQPVHLEAAAAEAESQLARAQKELANLPFAIRTAEARLNLAKQVVEGKKLAGDAIPVRSLQKAQSELAAAASTVEDLKARRPALEEEAAAMGRRCKALQTRLKLLAEERRAVAESEAQVKFCEARLEQARLAVKAVEIRLQRMVVRAPMAGKVLEMLARPGDRLSGLDDQDGRRATNVVSMYDPQKLQVRVDVRLEDVPQVQVGQPVRIETAAVPGGLDGKVLRITSFADIQKNTLQVKVSVTAPPAVIKPEMLSQVTFIAPLRPDSGDKEGEDPLRLLVPRQLVSGGEGAAFVWIADRENSIAEKRPVRLGRAGTKELVEIAEGVTPLDKLIATGREGLRHGQRIRITGEDSSLGGASGFAHGPTSPRAASKGKPVN